MKKRMIHARDEQEEPLDLSAWNNCGQLLELKRGREAEVGEHRGRGRIGAK